MIDGRFVRFVRKPDVELNRLAGQLLDRMSNATPQKSGLRLPLAVVSSMYYATNERARNGFDGGSVSLPEMSDRERMLRWAIFPSSIGGFLGIAGWYYEWAIRYHKNPDLAVGLATRLMWGSGLHPPLTRERGRYVVPSFRAEWKTPGPIAPWISTVGPEIGYWIDLHSNASLPGWEKRQLSPGLTGAILAQKVRVSVAWVPSGYKIRGRDKPKPLVSVGFGDLTGLIYWFGQIL